MKKRAGLGTAIAAWLLGVCGAASAQIGDSNAPIEITSRQGEYFQNEGRGIYTGNVVATQGDSRITTDKLTMMCRQAPASAGSTEAPACEEMEQLIAEGNVYYTAPDVKIKGDKATYDFPNDTITITGDVILSRGEEGVVRGTQVVYAVGEGRTIITAGSNRVFTVLVQKKKDDPPSTPGAPAQPN